MPSTVMKLPRKYCGTLVVVAVVTRPAAIRIAAITRNDFRRFNLSDR